MKDSVIRCAGLLLGVCSALWGAAPSEQLVLARMDQAASKFQGAMSKVVFITHTDVINEEVTESGTFAMKREGDGVQAVFDILQPADSKRTIYFSGHQAKIYYPKLKEVDVFDLGKGSQQLDQFVMIGFGTSGTEVAKSYSVKVLGTEAIGGQSTVQVELVPRTEDLRKYVTRLDLWLSDKDFYPVREKVFEPSNDYRLATYSDLKINPPMKDALKLKPPAGVKTKQR